MTMPSIQRRLLQFATVLAVLVFGANLSLAHHVRVSFAEVAQTADLVFVGTVASQSSRLNEKGTMAYTDVTFADVEVVNATGRSKQKAASTITLTFPGGTVGSFSVSLCDTMRFETGARYVLCTLDDGQVYSNPLVGGAQGLFHVIRDSQTDEEFVTTAGGHAVVEMRGAELVSTTARVVGIERGTLRLDASTGANKSSVESAVSADGKPARPAVLQAADATARPLTLRSFVDGIRTVALRTTLHERAIPTGESGRFLRLVDGKVVAEPLGRPASGPIASTVPPVPLVGVGPAPAPASRALGKLNGGRLGACGFQELPIVMKQYPSTWWEYQVANDCMVVWNKSRDLFRVTPADGEWGSNGENEFGGYPTNATLMDLFEFAWNPDSPAMTLRYGGDDCDEIDETDVLLNPAYSFTADPNVSIGNPSVVNLRAALMHELGHVWGFMAGTFDETYDYDLATVMHGYYDEIVEDGWGLHAIDAWMVRVHYGWQHHAPDMGVESYFASNGLNNSTISGTKFKPGDPITLRGVTVENMSTITMQGVHLRFYLSTDNIITTDDVEMTDFYFWPDGFTGEVQNVADYTTGIPSEVADGTYYVGAIVTINGFEPDPAPWNNATYFADTITVERPVPIRIDDIKGFTPPNLRPWKIKMFGSDFREGMRVYLGTEGAEWTNTRLKHSGLFVLKGGNALKKMFPVGVEVPIRVVAPDGEEVTVSFTR
jgi:hypothetical protein